jgi:hypothetical protein
MLRSRLDSAACASSTTPIREVFATSPTVFCATRRATSTLSATTSTICTSDVVLVHDDGRAAQVVSVRLACTRADSPGPNSCRSSATGRSRVSSRGMVRPMGARSLRPARRRCRPPRRPPRSRRGAPRAVVVVRSSAPRCNGYGVCWTSTATRWRRRRRSLRSDPTIASLARRDGARSAGARECGSVRDGGACGGGPAGVGRRRAHGRRVGSSMNVGTSLGESRRSASLTHVFPVPSKLAVAPDGAFSMPQCTA